MLCKRRKICSQESNPAGLGGQGEVLFQYRSTPEGTGLKTPGCSRGGLRHHQSTPAPAIEAAASQGLALLPRPHGEFQEGTLPRGQKGSPALLNPAVVFLTCPQSLNCCCSKHTTTLFPRKLDRKHLLGSGGSPPSWFGITPTVRFLAFLFFLPE